MARLGDSVEKLRSKNAGPFWLTIDLFCGDASRYADVVPKVSVDMIAAAFDIDVGAVKRFDIANLHVIKFSLPRPTIQGAINDRDMHGASWAALLADIEI